MRISTSEVMQRQSLGLIQLGQCLCADPPRFPHHAPCQPRAARAKNPDFKAPEASTVKKTPQGSSPRSRRNLREVVQTVLMQNMYPLSSQALRANNCRISREFIFQYSTGNVRLPDTKPGGNNAPQIQV